MRIAVIGGGVSGLTCARSLDGDHEVTLFEKNSYLGGHTHTHLFSRGNQVHTVDSGFIVFNKKTYPNFCKLLNELRVPYKISDMSFSMNCERSGVEYNGTDLNRLFSQRRNLVRPSFYRLIWGILRFNKAAKRWLKSPSETETLGAFLARAAVPKSTQEHYVLPMGAAVWSTSPSQMLRMPAFFFLKFFENHGFLNVDDRPEWYVVQGGSKTYVEAIRSQFKGKVHLGTSVQKVRRTKSYCIVVTEDGEHQFDYVVFACHSNQALRLLENCTPEERDILSALPYQRNTAVIHSDASYMPKTQRAWASWNYKRSTSEPDRLCVTYHMNRLQTFESKRPFFVTLNPPTPIESEYVYKKVTYEHPLFLENSIRAQKRWHTISGDRRTFYCGAYWRYGFHEDGVWSALRVADQVNRIASKSAVGHTTSEQVHHVAC